MKSNYDTQFKSIDSLKWLPWVGDQYDQVKPENRIMVVGESHYYSEDEPGSFEKHENRDFTRIAIDEMAVNRQYYNTKAYPNFLRAFTGQESESASKVWNYIAFMNFVQKTINTIDKPGGEDFRNGWKTLFQVIRILQPSTVIFMGLEASNSFNHVIGNTKLDSDGIQRLQRLNNTYPRVTIISDNEGLNTKLVFIKHPSKYFSWSEWHEFLKQQIPQQIEFIQQQIH